MPALRPRKMASPHVVSERPPLAEVVVSRDSLLVTVSVPRIAPDDLDLVVTRQSVRMKSKKDPTGLNFVIPLPMTVEPGQFIMRHLNGVYDLTLNRSSA